MSARTVKAKLYSDQGAPFINLPIRVTTSRTGQHFVSVRIGNTGQVVSLRADQARKLADTLHDRLDQIDNNDPKGIE